MKIESKKYNIYQDGVHVMKAEYPASAENCFWFNLKMWNPDTGFVKSAEMVRGDGSIWSIKEI